jgi:hypothetical protein
MLTFNSAAFSATTEYKVGDNCKDIQEIDYPEGLWCGLGKEGNFYFSEIPYQLDDSQVAILTNDIEGVDCTKVKTRDDCENLARIIATETIVNKFELTKKQAEVILSCHEFESYNPPDFSDQGIYIEEGPWENGAPRFCYWYKYPNVSSAERFSNLDGGAKASILFFFGTAILFFILFFTAQNKEKGAANLISRLVKTVLAVGGVALFIVFGVWLFVVVIEPLFSGTKIDLSKKIFGVPQYMLLILNAIYFIAWNSNKKK